MKLAFVTSWLSGSGGGVSTAVQGLSRAVAKNISISVLGLEDNAWSEDRQYWQGAPAKAFRTMGPRSLGFSFGLRNALTSLDPDIVHTHGIWMHYSADVVAWAKKRKPFIASPHGMLDPWAAARSPSKKRLARAFYEDRHLHGASCVHAVSAAEALAIREFGLTKPICVIPNGVDLPAPAPKPPPPWPDDGRRVLLYLGRIHPKKNIHGLLTAIAEIRSRQGLKDWRLIIAGPNRGAYSAQLKLMAAELNLERDIEFAGPVSGSKKDAAFRNAEAFVLPSLSEGLPMAVLEAWAYGLPAAISRNCNLPEGLESRAAWEIHTVPAEMAVTLGEFLHLAPAELTAMGTRGRALAQNHFSWGEAAAKFHAVYNWMLGGGPWPANLII